jgi:hypothetical protein
MPEDGAGMPVSGTGPSGTTGARHATTHMNSGGFTHHPRMRRALEKKPAVQKEVD